MKNRLLKLTSLFDSFFVSNGLQFLLPKSMIFPSNGIPRAFRNLLYFGINYLLILEASWVAKGAQLGTQDEVQTCLDGVLGRPERASKNDLELTQLQPLSLIHI